MRVLLIFILAFSVAGATPIHKTIDELLEGEESGQLNIPSYDPFKRAKPLLVRKKQKAPVYKPAALELSAVLNEKAFINGRWYKKGDTLAKARVIKVNEKSVYLKKGSKIKILRLKKKRKMLGISEKDKR